MSHEPASAITERQGRKHQRKKERKTTGKSVPNFQGTLFPFFFISLCVRKGKSGQEDPSKRERKRERKKERQQARVSLNFKGPSCLIVYRSLCKKDKTT